MKNEIVNVSQNMDVLLGTIYDEISQERPWVSSLESLRQLIPCNTMALEAKIATERAPTYYFAAGHRVDVKDISIWEHRGHDEIEELNFTENPLITCNDWRKRCVKPGYLYLLKKYDVLRSMSAYICNTESVEYSLHAGRSIEAPCFSAQEEEIFLTVSSHFARAIRLRLQFTHTKLSKELQADALDRLAVGAIVIESHNRISLLNEMAACILREQDCFTKSHNGLRAVDREVDKELQQKITEMLSENTQCNSSKVHAISIPRTSENTVYDVVINRKTIFDTISSRLQSSVLIFIYDPEAEHCKDSTIYQQLYKFTRAEANLAAELANGYSIEEVENRLGIKHNTARAHLRAMFSKTGVSSRAELTRLLVNSITPLASEESTSASAETKS